MTLCISLSTLHEKFMFFLGKNVLWFCGVCLYVCVSVWNNHLSFKLRIYFVPYFLAFIKLKWYCTHNFFFLIPKLFSWPHWWWQDEIRRNTLVWRKSSFGFFHNILWKNQNELFGQPNKLQFTFNTFNIFKNIYSTSLSNLQHFHEDGIVLYYYLFLFPLYLSWTLKRLIWNISFLKDLRYFRFTACHMRLKCFNIFIQ